jgi:hypothetical protein
MADDGQKTSLWLKLTRPFRRNVPVVTDVQQKTEPPPENPADKTVLHEIDELLEKLETMPGHDADMVNSRRAQIDSFVLQMRRTPEKAMKALERMREYLERDIAALEKTLPFAVAEEKSRSAALPVLSQSGVLQTDAPQSEERPVETQKMVPEKEAEQVEIHDETQGRGDEKELVAHVGDGTNDTHRSAEDIQDEVTMLLAKLKSRNVISDEHHQEETDKLDVLMREAERKKDAHKFDRLRNILVEKRNRLRNMLSEEHTHRNQEELVHALHELERHEVTLKEPTYVATTHWPPSVTNIQSFKTKEGHEVHCGQEGRDSCVFRMPKAAVQPHALVPHDPHDEHFFSMQAGDLHHALSYVNEHVLNDDNKIEDPFTQKSSRRWFKKSRNLPVVAPSTLPVVTTEPSHTLPMEMPQPVEALVERETVPHVPKAVPVFEEVQAAGPIAYAQPTPDVPETQEPEQTLDAVAKAIQDGMLKYDIVRPFVDASGVWRSIESVLQTVGVTGKELVVLTDVITKRATGGIERAYRVFGDPDVHQFLQDYIQRATPHFIGMGAKKRLREVMHQLNVVATELLSLEEKRR